MRTPFTTIPVMAAALCLALPHGDAPASALGDLASAMEPGTWAELNALETATALTSANAGGGASGIITFYTDEAAWNPTSGEIYVLGGDHNWGLPTTLKVVVYSVEANSWRQLPTPGWASGVVHGYDHTAIDQTRGILYHRPFNSWDVHLLELASATWDTPALPALPFTSEYNNCCDGLEYMPELDGLVWVSGSQNVYRFDDTTDEWSIYEPGLSLGGTWHASEYNPEHQVLVFFSSETGDMYKLDSAGTITQLADPPVDFYDGSGAVGVFTSDPVSGEFLLLSPTTRVLHTYEVTSDSWATPTASPTQPDWNGDGVVATPLPAYGVTFFAGCSNGGGSCYTYLYKHTPTPPDTLAPASPTAVTVQ